jgi:hypothetical protein
MPRAIPCVERCGATTATNSPRAPAATQVESSTGVRFHRPVPGRYANETAADSG